MRISRIIALMAAAFALAACDDENVSWAFVSNPSGGSEKHPGGGTIIVVKKTSPSPVPEGAASLRQTGVDERGPVTVHLATGADMVALEYEDAIGLRSPVLPGGGVVLPGATMRVRFSGPVVWELSVPDGGGMHSAAVGRARVLAAATGNVLALQHGGGLILFGAGAGEQPEVLGLDYRLEEAGEHLRLLLPAQPPRELRGSAPPAVEQRLAFDTNRDSIRIFGPFGDPVAELPRAAVSLQSGAGGIFLRGAFPDGLPPLPGPFALVMAADNRYLLWIE